MKKIRKEMGWYASATKVYARFPLVLDALTKKKKTENKNENATETQKVVLLGCLLFLTLFLFLFFYLIHSSDRRSATDGLIL